MFGGKTSYDDPVSRKVLTSIRNTDSTVYSNIINDLNNTLMSSELNIIQNTLKMERRLDSAPKKLGSRESQPVNAGIRALIIKMYSKQEVIGDEAPAIRISTSPDESVDIPTEVEIIKLLRALLSAGMSFNSKIAEAHRQVVGDIMGVGMASGELRKITKELVIEGLPIKSDQYYYNTVLQTSRDILEGKDLRDEL